MFHALRAAGGTDLGDHHTIPDKRPDDVQVVACVRNHFDWFVSSWIKATWRSQDPILQTMPFPEWLEKIHLPNSLYANFTYKGYIQISPSSEELYQPLWERCDNLLRYESIGEELETILEKRYSTPERINTTPHKKDYRLYYSQPLREEVERRYGEEMRELGYSFDNGIEWQPRDDSKPLTGGGLFDANNIRRTKLREHSHWLNLKNNPS